MPKYVFLYPSGAVTVFGQEQDFTTMDARVPDFEAKYGGPLVVMEEAAYLVSPQLAAIKLESDQHTMRFLVDNEARSRAVFANELDRAALLVARDAAHVVIDAANQVTIDTYDPVTDPSWP